MIFYQPPKHPASSLVDKTTDITSPGCFASPLSPNRAQPGSPLPPSPFQGTPVGILGVLEVPHSILSGWIPRISRAPWARVDVGAPEPPYSLRDPARANPSLGWVLCRELRAGGLRCWGRGGWAASPKDASFPCLWPAAVRGGRGAKPAPKPSALPRGGLGISRESDGDPNGKMGQPRARRWL